MKVGAHPRAKVRKPSSWIVRRNPWIVFLYLAGSTCDGMKGHSLEDSLNKHPYLYSALDKIQGDHASVGQATAQDPSKTTQGIVLQ